MVLPKRLEEVSVLKSMGKNEELKKIKGKLEKCEEEKEEYLNGWQRAKADFLNYKKEEEERINKILKHSNESLILKLLPVLDNFREARREIDKTKENNKIMKGFLQIEKQLKDILTKEGVEKIEAEGEEFNPEFHDAVERIDNKKKSGTVLEEIKAGYKYKGKVIRPAKVKVAK